MTDITELAQSLKRRATSANEFGESLYVKADDVLSLVEALEKAQAKNALVSGGIEATAKLHERIAELESRTVKLPKKNIGWDRDEEDCWNNAIDACAEVLAAAGIKVEAE